jgi:hypothetical protein
MNVISILIGIVALILMLPGLVPLLGLLQWLVVVLCVIGILFGALSKQKSGMAVNGAILVIAILRLFLGGGIL